jgi:hypothetical protein
MTETSDQRRSSHAFPREENSFRRPPPHLSTGKGSQEAHRCHTLFEGRKRLGDNGLIVMEEAASERRQSHREDRQDGDHTHYTAPLRKTLVAQRTTFRAAIGGEIATAHQ